MRSSHCLEADVYERGRNGNSNVLFVSPEKWPGVGQTPPVLQPPPHVAKIHAGEEPAPEAERHPHVFILIRRPSLEYLEYGRITVWKDTEKAARRQLLDAEVCGWHAIRDRKSREPKLFQPGLDTSTMECHALNSFGLPERNKITRTFFVSNPFRD